jgi:hypothetical protein
VIGKSSFLTLLTKIAKYCPNLILPFLQHLNQLFWQERGLNRRQLFSLIGNTIVDTIFQNRDLHPCKITSNCEHQRPESNISLRDWKELFLVLTQDKDPIIRAHSMHFLIRIFQYQLYTLNDYTDFDRIIVTFFSFVC